LLPPFWKPHHRGKRVSLAFHLAGVLQVGMGRYFSPTLDAWAITTAQFLM
jgi:hypothetical protein